MNGFHRPRCFFAAIVLASILLGGGSDRRPAEAAGPKAGARLPNLLAGAQLRNAPVDAPAPRGWVVYVFRPDCSACEKTMGEAASLAASLPADWAFLAAVPGKPEEAEPFVARLSLLAPVLTQIPGPTLAAYKVSREPLVYILDRDWRLLEAQAGPLDHKRALALATRFKVDLKPAPKPVEPGPRQPGAKEPRNLCRDLRQAPYSRGAKADVLGFQFRCGPGGAWLYSS